MSENKKVLVVDDSKVARLTIREMMRRVNPGISITDLGSPQEALDLIVNEDFDLISLDFNMPEMNGLELALKLKEIKQNLKIVILTANIQQSIRDKVESQGISFLQKPINEKVVRMILDMVS